MADSTRTAVVIGSSQQVTVEQEGNLVFFNLDDFSSSTGVLVYGYMAFCQIDIHPNMIYYSDRSTIRPNFRQLSYAGEDTQAGLIMKAIRQRKITVEQIALFKRIFRRFADQV